MASVLVVDDDGVIAQMVARIVEFYGHSPVIETSSFTAAARVASGQIDFGAAIVDLLMPDLNGIELLAVVQQAQPKARRILLTASPREDGVAQAKAEGVIHRVISKPPSLADMELALAWL